MNANSLLGQSGVLITLCLIMLPLLAAALLTIIKANAFIGLIKRKKALADLKSRLESLSPEEIAQLGLRKKEIDFDLTNTELGSSQPANDRTGLIDRVKEADSLRFFDKKQRTQAKPDTDPALTRLILWYLGTAVFWLVVGTTAGEYLGIKFSAPDIDHISWLSFGRLRPVHTNAVFWGWCSLAMLGLSYYVVPKVSNAPIHSVRRGYLTLVLANMAVLAGSLCLMAGINNGGGEYREYIWPVMVLFGSGILITLINFFNTIARRTTKEIYVSNWYVSSALMFLLVIVFVAYWPDWQNGLGETIIQGYYMHQGVGMWFMLLNLGLMYYFLPQQLNKPIYSYSLGTLAFWTQILFYTVIGTHHFIFSSIPWWMQTVAIVGSAGMVIPVIAGTTNFLMTFRGSWNKVAHSYTLPFYLAGIIFYFTGSLQGTAEAFRFTNLLWHFTDFTVAHSHLTMYGIITFMLWAFIYTLIPRLTGNEPPQAAVGAHFWLAFIGLMFYTVPLMIGGTLKGLMWMDGKPFIDGVVAMAPYWLWRAIGGTLMWLSHCLFAYNFYRMVVKRDTVEIPEMTSEILETQLQSVVCTISSLELWGAEFETGQGARKEYSCPYTTDEQRIIGSK